MARIGGGIKALFKSATVRKALDKQIENIDRKVITSLQFLGEQFVNKARLDGNYTDRTGNLRSSIGYIILKEGRIVKSNFSGNEDGKNRGKEFAEELAREYRQGFVLIGVAGMKYAAYVEARNFDVITGSAPSAEIVKNLFDEINS